MAEATTETTETTETKTDGAADKAASASQDAVKTDTSVVKDDTKSDKPDEGWWGSIPDELARKWARRFASPADAVMDGYRSRQQLSNAIVLPAKNAKPEEVAAFRKKLGVPLNPEGYQFEAPEGHTPTDFDKAFQATIGKALWEENIPDRAAKKLSKVYNDFVSEMQRQTTENDERSIEEAQTVLGRKWGSDAKANIAAGEMSLQEAAKSTGNQDLLTLKNLIVTVGDKKKLLGNIPLFMEYAAFFGRRLMEGQAHVPVDGETVKSAASELDTLYALRVSEKLEEKAKYKTAAVQARIKELEEIRVRAKKARAA